MAAVNHSSRRSSFTIVASIIVALLFLALFQPRHHLQQLIRPNTTPDIGRHDSYKDLIPLSLSTTTSKYAYVTLLAPDRSQAAPKDFRDDVYFSALRLLAYQLLHARETRSEGIPFIVLTVPGVPEAQKDRLRKDGAMVLEIEHIALPEWMSHSAAPNYARFADMFDKFRAWELTQFDRIIFVDADVVLRAPIHPLFEWAELRHPKGKDIGNKPTPPTEYVFAASTELNEEHKFPPTNEGHDFSVSDSYFNGGFFILKPSLDVYRWYMESLAIPDSFPTDMMEQNFLNELHNLDGNMPRQPIEPIWHMHWPTQADFDAGVRSFHEKWWMPRHNVTAPFFLERKARMDGFFEAWDALTIGS